MEEEPRNRGGLQKQEKVRKGFFPEASRRNSPAVTLIFSSVRWISDL